MLLTTACQKEADSCQKELRRLILSVAGNITARSMLLRHTLFVFSQRHKVNVTSLRTVCVVNYESPAAVVSICSEDVKVTVVYSWCRNIARLILQTHLNLSVLNSCVQN